MTPAQAEQTALAMAPDTVTVTVTETNLDAENGYVVHSVKGTASVLARQAEGRVGTGDTQG